MIDPSIVDISSSSSYFTVLEDLLDDLQGEQVIIFAHFHRSIDLIEKMLKKKKCTYEQLHGRISAKNKQAVVEGFKQEKFQVLLANAKSAGVGLDFQQCHNVIFFELDYEVDSFWQGQDRLHRPGQEHEVNVFVLVARNTPAVGLFRAVKTNINYVKQVLEGKEDASTLFDNKITVKEEQEWKKL
jgi:SNF2 family DNA or RNA helicase